MDLEKLLPVPPKKDDVLIAQDRDNWHLNAVIRPMDDYAYCLGYRRAARLLVQAAEHGDVDTLVYPICHSYRHYVELMLKRLIVMGCRITGRELTIHEARLCNEKHDLSRLWDAFKAIESEVMKEANDRPRPPEDMVGIKAYIDQLHAIDSGSYSFRYAVTKKGEATLEGVGFINLGRFGLYMERLANYLEGFDTYYGYMLDQITDMDAYYSVDNY